MLFAGLDLRKQFSVVTAMNGEGKVIRQAKAANDEVLGFFQELREASEVAVEAARNWYWLYDLLEENGIEVRLSHPLKTKAIV